MSENLHFDFTPVLTDLGEGWASTPPHQPGPTAKQTRRLGHRRADLSKKGLWLQLLGTYQVHGPLTDAEMAEKLRIDRSTVNARRNELLRIGKVHDTGKTRKNQKSGVENTLWGLV